MGKRRNKNDESNLKPKICQGATLREECSGKKVVDVSSILKIKHLQNLTVWAGGEGGVPPLGAFFGYRLAANAEASGHPLDKSHFICQRCESILQTGFNCTIRIETCKNKKRKRSKKNPPPLQNNVIYHCNFCNHRNPIKGTIKGHAKNLLSSRESSRSKLASESEQQPSSKEAATAEKAQSNSFSGNLSQSDQKTPLQRSADLSRKKRIASDLKGGKQQFSSGGAELSGGGGSGKGSSRRKRKGWSSLKDIVEKDAASGKNDSSLVIPFFL